MCTWFVGALGQPHDNFSFETFLLNKLVVFVKAESDKLGNVPPVRA